MTTLRNASSYNIGLDIGTGSVGWAVTDQNGDLLRFKGKPTWGSRLFDNANSAKDARVYRGQRRRYDRRRQRLDRLQMLFALEVTKVDPDFFIRLNQSRLHSEDRDTTIAPYRWLLFNVDHPLIIDGQQITEAQYYKLFPTIYHLRVWLMRTSEKVDIRLIYLAFHNIVKARGNFIYQDLGNEGLSARNADMKTSISRFVDTFREWLLTFDRDNELAATEIDEEQLEEAFSQQGITRQKRQEVIIEAFKGNGKLQKNMAKAFAQSFLGYKANLSHIFGVTDAEDNSFKLSLSDDEGIDKFVQACPDTGIELFEIMRSVYASFVLQGILHIAQATTYWTSATEGTQLAGTTFDASQDLSISASKVIEYGRYHDDLRLLKNLVKKYYPGKKVEGLERTCNSATYNKFFRGPYLSELGSNRAVRGSGKKFVIYDPIKVNKKIGYGYTAYNEGVSCLSYDDFYKQVTKLFGCKIVRGKLQAENAMGEKTKQDSNFVDMMQKFEDGTFLRRLKTSSSGVIPYQLHLEEMHEIINKQVTYYPFLADEYTTRNGIQRNKIESLVTFRIPYYVGPLTQRNAAKDKKGNNRFAWSVRQPECEHTAIHPWNWDDIIDKEASADAFMRRMIGSCTYLWGEPVLPKCSLIYEKYCVLNELNGAHYTNDNETHRFDVIDRRRIFEELFCRQDSVSYNAIKKFMSQHNMEVKDVSGGQGEKGFESKLTSYRFFCKLLGKSKLTKEDEAMAEEIIEWNTLFEDRAILRDKVQNAYGNGNPLDDKQVQKVCRKRFTGWGRLSKKLLCGIKIEVNGKALSVMDVLCDGYPLYGEKGVTKRRNDSMVLMEILHDDTLGFQKKIDDNRTSSRLEINDLPYASPALRRSINQTLRIVEEIVSIAGKLPANIYIETTRDDDVNKKGIRTIKRADRIEKQLKELHDEFHDNDILEKFEEKKTELDDDRLMLYFLQNGKCLYSGRPLNINELSKYQIDHIIPQCYIKDDSIENRALVYAEENQRKKDTLLLDNSIQKKMMRFWEALHAANLIGDKKYRNLTRTTINDRQMKGFINRQLVETSQIVKFVVKMLQERYPEIEGNIHGIKANLSHQLRLRWDNNAGHYVWRFPKVREMNDYHHAHDAYLAAEVGRFINKRFPYLYNNPIGVTNIMRKYIKDQADDYQTKRRPPAFCFIISSFLRNGFDKTTGEIFIDDWDAGSELARIRKYFSLPDCFITRMPVIDTGAFSNATIYSPRDKTMGNNLKLELKAGLDTKKYGGYSSEQFAYFFIFEKKDKRGQHKMVFGTVPVRVASRVHAGGRAALEKYAISLLTDEESFIRIVRNRIYKNQILEINDQRVYLRGFRMVRNARELAFNIEDAELISKLVHKQPTSDEQRLKLFDLCSKKIARFAPDLARFLKLDKWREGFKNANENVQTQALLAILANVNAQKNMIDLSGIGGKAHAGCISFRFTKELNKKKPLYVIDTSVTGMFETRVNVASVGV